MQQRCLFGTVVQGECPDAGQHGTTTVTNSRNLTAGWHSIEVDYFDAGGSANLVLSWKAPNATSYTVSGLSPCSRLSV